LSNANDALEKLRLISLTEKDIIDPSEPLNITIKTIKAENGDGGRIIITGLSIFTLLHLNCLGTRWYRHWYWYVSRGTYGQSRQCYYGHQRLLGSLKFVIKGTLAKSGTSEFIARAESGADGGNLIGAFGRKSTCVKIVSHTKKSQLVSTAGKLLHYNAIYEVVF
jgi:heat shock protein 90kDa beta